MTKTLDRNLRTEMEDVKQLDGAFKYGMNLAATKARFYFSITNSKWRSATNKIQRQQKKLGSNAQKTCVRAMCKSTPQGLKIDRIPPTVGKPRQRTRREIRTHPGMRHITGSQVIKEQNPEKNRTASALAQLGPRDARYPNKETRSKTREYLKTPERTKP